MVTRPNTLPFSPNEHNLDGLYMSNDYDDEDESDQQHNSGPDTGSTEARRSSLLLNDQHTKHGHTPIDPDDILRRLSLVEKARAEGILHTLDRTVLEFIGFHLAPPPPPMISLGAPMLGLG